MWASEQQAGGSAGENGLDEVAEVSVRHGGIDAGAAVREDGKDGDVLRLERARAADGSPHVSPQRLEGRQGFGRLREPGVGSGLEELDGGLGEGEDARHEGPGGSVGVTALVLDGGGWEGQR